MAYPPQFSSTLTYANRYDLNEIDVFLEGDSNNPMLFDINGLPDYLTFGKHYFHLSTLDSTNQSYQLRNESRILFEFKSINNVVLRSDVVKLNQRNGITTCYVEVLKDPLRTMKEVEDGTGTLAIVGSIERKKHTTVEPIPKKFIGAMNYRCIFPIQIGKNLQGALSPFITNTEHTLDTLNGRYSFKKAHISPPRLKEGGLTYDKEGNPDIPGGLAGTEGGTS